MKTFSPGEPPDPAPDAPGVCRFAGKALKGNPRPEPVDVDALLESLEARSASRRDHVATEAAPGQDAAEDSAPATILKFRTTRR